MVTKDRIPFFIVEVKSSTSAGINPALPYFQKITGARHAFQAAYNMEFIERDCFEEKAPVRVPVLTLLSQLV